MHAEAAWTKFDDVDLATPSLPSATVSRYVCPPPLKERLQLDLTRFADEYHDRVLKGLALPAESFDQEGDGDEAGEGGGEGEGAIGGGRGRRGKEPQQEATILADGTIDVTPVELPPPVVRQSRRLVYLYLIVSACCVHAGLA